MIKITIRDLKVNGVWMECPQCGMGIEGVINIPDAIKSSTKVEIALFECNPCDKTFIDDVLILVEGKG